MRWPFAICVGVSLLAACDAGKPPITRTPASESPAAQPALANSVPAVPADAAVASESPPPDAPDPFQALFAKPAAHITKDGAFVLLAVIDDDGARGEPNLVFEVRDRKDKTVERVVVLELDKPEPDPAEKGRRVAAVDKLFASREWVEMTTLTGDADHEGHFDGSGMTVDWTGRMKITRAGKKLVDRAVPAKWRGRSYYSKNDDLTCNNPDFLSGVFMTPDHPLVVVDVAYHGNDTCWEPTSELHVVSW